MRLGFHGGNTGHPPLVTRQSFRGVPCGSSERRDAPESILQEAVPMSSLLGLRSPDPHCRVCGCGEVVLDYAPAGSAAHDSPAAVHDRARGHETASYALELGLCPRCDHRWTRPLRLPSHHEVQRAAAVRMLSGPGDVVPNAA